MRSRNPGLLANKSNTPPIRGFQINAQDQAAHQLPLGKIMPTGISSVLRQMPLAQFHRQFRHLFHHRNLLLIAFFAHADSRRSPRQKGFYKAR
jgi:hypothetical protein